MKTQLCSAYRNIRDICFMYYYVIIPFDIYHLSQPTAEVCI